MLKQGAPVREFTDAGALLGHYAEVQRRVWSLKPAPQRSEDRGVWPVPDARPVEMEAERAAKLSALSDRLMDPATRARQPRSIITRVAHQHGLTYEDVVGTSRKRRVVLARRDAIGAVKAAHPLMSLPVLGSHLNVDHATVHHALRRLRGESPSEAQAARKTKGAKL